MTLTRRDAPRLFSSWLLRNGYPYTENRFTGQPHACIAVNTQGLQIAEVGQLWDLIDYKVSAVCGPFTELQKTL